MKRAVHIPFLLLLCSAGLSQTQAFLDANNVRALILNRNDMFWSPSNGTAQYEVPKGSNKHCNFVGSLWLGGLDAGGQLHMAGMTYRQNGVDFWPGPLDTINGVTDATISATYNKLWKINRQEVLDFKAAWISGAVTAGNYTPSAAFLSWPGNGNTASGFASRLAPFVDVNNDGLYTPLTAGDYPLIKGDQMIYYIVNDNLDVHSETGGVPLGVEMHVSAYSYSCTAILSNYPEINNTTFYHYKVINRSSNTYTNTVAGIFSDVDLGQYNNDYIGCSPDNRLGYAYNATSTDLKYGATPPITSYQVLKGPLADPGDGIDNDHDGTIDETGEEILFSSFMYYNNNLGTFNPATINPGLPSDYYGYMKAIWKDGSPLRADSTGFFHGSTTVQATPYAFPGDPLALTGWTEFSKNNAPSDRRFIIGNGPFTFAPGETFELEYSILTTFDASGSNGHKNIPLVKQENASILNFYNLQELPECAATQTVTGISERMDFTVTLVPNPAESAVTLRVGRLVEAYADVYDILGQLKSQVRVIQGEAHLNIRDWPAGIYIVAIDVDGRRHTARLVKE